MSDTPQQPRLTVEIYSEEWGALLNAWGEVLRLLDRSGESSLADDEEAKLLEQARTLSRRTLLQMSALQLRMGVRRTG
jgi:hypothetical protein